MNNNNMSFLTMSFEDDDDDILDAIDENNNDETTASAIDLTIASMAHTNTNYSKYGSNNTNKSLQHGKNLPTSSGNRQMICINHKERRMYLSVNEFCAASNTIETLLYERKLHYDEELKSYIVDISSEKIPIESVESFVKLCRLGDVDNKRIANERSSDSWKALPLIKKYDCIGLQHLIFAQITKKPSFETIAMYDRLFQPNVQWPYQIKSFIVNSIKNDKFKDNPSYFEHLSKKTLIEILFSSVNFVLQISEFIMSYKYGIPVFVAHW